MAKQAQRELSNLPRVTQTLRLCHKALEALPWTLTLHHLQQMGRGCALTCQQLSFCPACPREHSEHCSPGTAHVPGTSRVSGDKLWKTSRVDTGQVPATMPHTWPLGLLTAGVTWHSDPSVHSLGFYSDRISPYFLKMLYCSLPARSQPQVFLISKKIFWAPKIQSRCACHTTLHLCPPLTLISSLWLMASAECSRALMTEAYESENLVYFPTRAIEQVSSKRSYLSHKGQETSSYSGHTYSHEIKITIYRGKKKNKSEKNMTGVTTVWVLCTEQ